MFLIILASVVKLTACGQEIPFGLVEHNVNNIDLHDNSWSNTDLLLSFVVFRHGDRTPDLEELRLYHSDPPLTADIFYPFGTKALTNKGKQRAYLVGQYLRKRYDGFISDLYLPDQMIARSTAYDRTKMTVLTALAALYPPPLSQKWNPALDWQPVPYNTEPFLDDDLLYWYNCQRYISLRNQLYDLPEVKEKLKPYEGLFNFLNRENGNMTSIKTPEDVFFLDNLFQTLENVGVSPPEWAKQVMPSIQELTKIEYSIEFYNPELIRIASGVLMGDFIKATKSYIAEPGNQPRLRLYSAHENNVYGFLAASKAIFDVHQPKYGSTFALEFRRNPRTGRYGVLAVYAETAGGPDKILPIRGCGSQTLCDYDTFVNLTQDVVMTMEEFKAECPKPVAGSLDHPL